MFENKFDYSDAPINVKKVIYDLSLAFAKAKFEDKLTNDNDFSDWPVSEEIGQAEYLMNQFLFALDYYSGTESGDLERCLERQRKD